VVPNTVQVFFQFKRSPFSVEIDKTGVEAWTGAVEGSTPGGDHPLLSNRQ
jgi:hypothetical protein